MDGSEAIDPTHAGPVSAADARPAPRQGGPMAWYVVALLTLFYILSFLDRQILLLLVGPLHTTLHLSDTDIALLFGLGFGVVYTTVGMPLAHWLDTTQRVRIVVAGVVLWSLSTIASAFAENYPTLLALRSGVAIGEAVLSPAAISLIADLFQANRRTLPTAVYSAIGVVAPSGSFVIGGFALALATAMGPALAIAPWRLTLIVVGLPGLVLAGLMALTVREPLRSDHAAGPRSHVSVGQAFAYVARYGRLWGSLFLAMSLAVTVSSALVAWTTTLLVRAHGMAAPAAAYAFGTAGIIGAAGGIVLWPWLASAWAKRGRKDALVIVLGVGMVIFCVSVAAVGRVQSVPVLLAAVTVAMLGMSTMASLPNLIIQAVAPPRLRARLAAGNLIASGLVGLFLGSYITALLAKKVFTGTQGLGLGMSLVAVTVLPLVVITILVARPAFAKAVDEAAVEGWGSTSG